MSVGDFDYRETLEALAAASSCPDRVTFTGALPRESLGVVYASMNVFVFPSLTDTQGWVVHEAALSGLPIVLLDRELSEVMQPGVNGEYAENDADSIAERVIELLSHPVKCREYGVASQKTRSSFYGKASSQEAY